METPAEKIAEFLKKNKISHKKIEEDDTVWLKDGIHFIMFTSGEYIFAFFDEEENHESVDLKSSKKLEGLLSIIKSVGGLT